MSSSTDSESEILLGNKQLLAVFGVVAVLLAVAFTGGYMVGKSGAEKKTNSADGSTVSADSGAVITRTVPPNSTADGETKDTASDGPYVPVPLGMITETTKETVKQSEAVPVSVPPPAHTAPSHAVAAPPPSGAEAGGGSSGFTPQQGQTFLQVAAVGRDEADAVADVLHKKGFRAHSVPKPGNPKIYRVLIGPVKDAGDLAATRDSLRKTGFREVITQHY